jgi:hypothetical protein
VKAQNARFKENCRHEKDRNCPRFGFRHFDDLPQCTCTKAKPENSAHHASA